jgi:quercetin dioxygenase-like cupin family protein
MTPEPRIEAAAVILPCTDLQPTLDFFRERLGFRLHAILPADDPQTAVLSGYGLRLRLQRQARGSPVHLHLLCTSPDSIADGQLQLQAPNGTRVFLESTDHSVALPELQSSLQIARAADARWQVGRAGMCYRDLIPGRQGGRFIASLIRIDEAGPVADDVHFHAVFFQTIYCLRGWVRLVYEDQGPPFVLRAGDCVLQPPGIRHRVLECSAGLEVVEISGPAQHETRLDYDLTLPTAERRPERRFGGQNFAHHIADKAGFSPWTQPGFSRRDTGMEQATDGLASVCVVRRDGFLAEPTPGQSHDDELLFVLLLQGSLELLLQGTGRQILTRYDALTLPAGISYRILDSTEDVEFLEVRVTSAEPRAS